MISVFTDTSSKLVNCHLYCDMMWVEQAEGRWWRCEGKETVVLPLLVCLIFGLSMAVIARPHAHLSACSCTSSHPTPVSPSASLSPLLLALTFCSAARQQGGWVSRGWEENGKRRGRRRWNYPSFFLHTVPVVSTPPLFTLFIVVHPPGVYRGGFAGMGYQ